MDISRMKRQQLKIKLNPIYYTENKNNIFTLPCRYWDWKSKNQETYRSVGLNIFGPTLTLPTPFSFLHYFSFATSMNSLLHSRPSWWASRHSYSRPLVSSQRRKKVHVSCPVRPLKLVHPALLWLRLLENLADFALFSVSFANLPLNCTQSKNRVYGCWKKKANERYCYLGEISLNWLKNKLAIYSLMEQTETSK